MKHTKVIFRKYKSNGDIVAMFPQEYNHANYMHLMYEHIGQHGEGDWNHVIRITKPAKPSEYEDLKAELVRQGYNDLKIVKRKSRGDSK